MRVLDCPLLYMRGYHCSTAQPYYAFVGCTMI
jgi:hypothetical protein